MPGATTISRNRRQTREALQSVSPEGRIAKYQEMFQMSPEEKQSMFDELIKYLSTSQELAATRAEEEAAYNRASPATARATQSGIAYQSALAGEQGITDLQQWLAEYNRRGTAMAFDQYNKDRMIALQREAMDKDFIDQLSSLLGSVGHGVGYAFGAKAFG